MAYYVSDSPTIIGSLVYQTTIHWAEHKHTTSFLYMIKIYIHNLPFPSAVDALWSNTYLMKDGQERKNEGGKETNLLLNPIYFLSLCLQLLLIKLKRPLPSLREISVLLLHWTWSMQFWCYCSSNIVKVGNDLCFPASVKVGNDFCLQLCTTNRKRNSGIVRG